jgi:hypothetical protein
MENELRFANSANASHYQGVIRLQRHNEPRQLFGSSEEAMPWGKVPHLDLPARDQALSTDRHEAQLDRLDLGAIYHTGVELAMARRA